MICLWLLCPPGWAAPSARSGLADEAAGGSPRERFLAAEAAIARGDLETYQALADGLQDDPLYPYLRVGELMRRLDQASADEVVALLDVWRGTAPGERLRLYWLKRLAREGRLAEYAELYVENGSETRECLFRRGLNATGRQIDAFDGIDRLYLSADPLPRACDPLLDAWADAGGLSARLVWERIGLLLERGDVARVRQQRAYLPATDQSWLDRLLALHERPGRVLDPMPGAHPQRAMVLTHAVERLARRDVSGAIAAWTALQQDEAFPPALAERVWLAIGKALARGGDSAALDWLGRIPARAENTRVQQQRLRAALRLRAWGVLPDWIDALPAPAHTNAEWRYWKGRALEARGDADGAAAAFRDAAPERDLWGFLAAARVGIAPNLAHLPVPADPGLVAGLRASPTIERIRALEALGRKSDVAREWRELTRGRGPEQLMAAAVVARELGLATEAIFTLARSGYWDDLELRFPLAYRGLVHAEAKRNGLPEDWVFAVIRQESAFDTDVASAAGAIGLMQLLPSTARDVAANARQPPPSRLALIDPRLNVALGSRYLAELLTRFDGNPVLATAAYNAGPGAVSRWLPTRPTAADLWIAEIPYAETRQYVQRVLAYRVLYAHRLGLAPARLDDWLRPVAGASPDIAAEGTSNGSAPPDETIPVM